jgi:hypothetical protein
VVSQHRAAGGILIGLGGFTRGRPGALTQAAEDPRIELVDKDAFSQMLAEVWGEAWVHHVERFIARGQRLTAKP